MVHQSMYEDNQLSDALLSVGDIGVAKIHEVSEVTHMRVTFGLENRWSSDTRPCITRACVLWCVCVFVCSRVGGEGGLCVTKTVPTSARYLRKSVLLSIDLFPFIFVYVYRRPGEHSVCINGRYMCVAFTSARRKIAGRQRLGYRTLDSAWMSSRFLPKAPCCLPLSVCFFICNACIW